MSNLTIGIDLAENVFQVHGIGSGGQVVLRRTLRDMGQRTMLVNALRTHLAELGLIAPKGIENVDRLVEAMKEAELPLMARQVNHPPSNGRQ